LRFLYHVEKVPAAFFYIYREHKGLVELRGKWLYQVRQTISPEVAEWLCLPENMPKVTTKRIKLQIYILEKERERERGEPQKANEIHDKDRFKASLLQCN